MIGKRRVLSILNELSTYGTFVFILMIALHFYIFFFNVSEDFTSFYLRLIDASYFSLLAVNAIVILFSFLFWITDYTFEAGYFFKSIIRILIITLIYLIVQVSEIAIERGFTVRL
ncbi:MAG: hypothetical protein K5634_04635 [Sphaerochaetaceae bacterium]|nr:hypothetical protein [Sphaerochaetaceae bacterium]